MKTTLLSIFTLTTALFLKAQETVEMGAGYANDVYYSLENGVVKTEPATNWDLAFSTGTYTSTIRINGGHGMTIKQYPGQDSFEDLDTAGYYTWDELYDSELEWLSGSFEDWGTYNPNNHYVYGCLLYTSPSPRDA